MKYLFLFVLIMTFKLAMAQPVVQRLSNQLSQEPLAPGGGRAASASQKHIFEKPSLNSPHGKAAADLPRSKNIPHGHTETPLTVKSSTDVISTKECGGVTELTILHRSHEPGMMVHIIAAGKVGRQLLLENAKCLGNGKAVATSVSFTPEPQKELAQADRCSLPMAAGNIKGC